MNAIAPEAVERFRPLLPVGYEAGVEAYRRAVAELTARDLADHYTAGLSFFHERFVPHLKDTLKALSGGVWDLAEFDAFAAGTDVDFMTHIVEAVASTGRVALYPGDWYGFLVGCSQTGNIRWDANGGGELSCLCIPSVRNGHLDDAMLRFLESTPHCLLNLNLFPTLCPEERKAASLQLRDRLDRAVLSISFSRGFGLTASQLGVVLIHRDHPYRRRFDRQWSWFTHFYNAVAARAFMLMDLSALQATDERRRAEVAGWLSDHGLPVVRTGSYYVKAFRPAGVIPDHLAPLERQGIVRLCFKPSVHAPVS